MSYIYNYPQSDYLYVKTNANFKGDLGVFLKEISTNNKIILRCDKNVFNQRVNIFFDSIDFKSVMTILIEILNHNSKNKSGYVWEEYKDEARRVTTYTLKKLNRAFNEEKEELDFPEKQILKILKTCRDNIKKPALFNRGNLYFSKDDPLGKLLSEMSDSQIESLVRSGNISLDGKVSDADIQLYHRDWVEKNKNNQIIYGENIPKNGPYEKPMFRLRSIDDQTKKALFIYGAYSSNNSGSVIDPYQYSDRESPNSGVMPEGIQKISDDRIIDLTPFLDAKDISEEMKSDLSFILKCLHKASGINLVHENFVYNDLMGLHQGKGIRIRKGKLKDIFYEIWNNYGYKCILKDDVYYLWSPTWAFNRRSDISDEIITSLKKEKDRKQGFDALDWMNIGSRLNRYQIQYALSIALKLGFMESGNTLRASLESLFFVSALPDYLKKSLLDGVTVWWQNIPADYRLKLNLEVMNELDYNRPPISYDKFSLMTAQGEISLSKRIVGAQTVENVTLNLQDASGKFLFYGSFQGLYTKPVAAKPAARPLPKRR
nr:hypothetical protein [Armatimonas sp.]